MIGLDRSRNIIRDMSYVKKDLSEKEFLVIDDYKDIANNHHFEPYSSNNLIYLGEMDLVYSIYDLKKGLLLRAPWRVGKDYIQTRMQKM